MNNVKWYLVVAVLTGALVGFSGHGDGADKKPMTVADLATYKGADRQQLLEAGAKKEGQLTFYTTGIVQQTVRPLTEAFMKRYPYIKVNFWRAGSDELFPRVIQEYKAGKYVVDVIELTDAGRIFLTENNILQPFYSPNLVYIEEGAIRKATGGEAFSAGHYQSYVGIGYNTKLIGKKDLPQTYQELADPKWKGKLPLGASNPDQRWMETILYNFGEELVKKLAQQNFAIHPAASPRSILDMVINGEYPFYPVSFDSHVNSSKQKGAPVEWLPLEPVFTLIGQIMLPKHSSNPHAALLYLDFDLSRQAGEIYNANGYQSPRKDIPGDLNVKKFYGAQSTKELTRSNDLFNTLFVRR